MAPKVRGQIGWTPVEMHCPAAATGETRRSTSGRLPILNVDVRPRRLPKPIRKAWSKRGKRNAQGVTRGQRFGLVT